MGSPRARRSWVRLLRMAALGGFLLGAAAIGLYLFGRLSKPKPTERPLRAVETEAGRVLEGKGIDFQLEREGNVVFRIHGARVIQDADENVFLEDVDLVVFREDGSRYTIASTKASFNRETQEAKLEGRVRLQGPRGLELRTAGLHLQDQGRVVVSTAPVELEYGRRLIARARVLRADFRESTYLLRGDVAVDNHPTMVVPFTVRCARLILEQTEDLLRAEGGVRLTWGPHRLDATSLSALIADGGGLEYVTARREVSGEVWMEQGGELAAIADAERRLPRRVTEKEVQQPRRPARAGEPAATFEPRPEPAAPPPGGTPIRFAAETLDLRLAADGETPRKLELDGGGAVPATIETVESTLTRTLRSARLVADFVDGELRTVDAPRPLLLRETPTGAPAVAASAAAGSAAGGAATAREISAGRGAARFDLAGNLAGVTLEGDVRYRQGQLSADADRAELLASPDRIELDGAPVVLRNERGELRAPRVVYTRDRGVVHGEGGVRARLEERGGESVLGTPLGEGQGPVYVEAHEGIWNQSPRSFVFSGETRAWQGEDVLVADQLHGNEETRQLAASGDVKTVWRPQAPAGGEPVERVEVTAENLVYQEVEGLLTYRGDVHVRQPPRDLTCGTLTVELDQENHAETMTCEGAVRLADEAQGSVVTGDHARYDLAARLVRITGEKVTLRDRQGNQVTGAAVVYDTAKGTARVEAPPKPAPVTDPTAAPVTAPGTPPTTAPAGDAPPASPPPSAGTAPPGSAATGSTAPSSTPLVPPATAPVEEPTPP